MATELESRRARPGRAAPRAATGRSAIAVLGVVTTLCLLAMVPDDDLARQVAFVLSLTVSSFFLVRGARGLRGWHRTEWLCVMWGTLVWEAAIIVVAVTGTGSGQVLNWVLAAFTSPIGYALVGVGVVRMALKEGLARDSAVWLESAIGVVSLLLSWWVLVGEQAFRGGVTGMALIANLYPLGDALLLAAALALLSSRTSSRRSSLVLLLALSLAILADIVFGSYAVGRLAAAQAMVAPGLWMAEFACLAGAITLAHRDEEPTPVSLSPLSLVGQAVGVLSPALLVFGGWVVLHRTPDTRTVVLVGAGTVLMAVLQTVRVLGLLRRIDRQAAELGRTARTDELTGLPNRRAGTRLLQDEMDRARRAGAPLTAAILDLDHFKAFNDTFGHLQGDKLLRAAGLRWQTALADRGQVYRYGGEEFVVVLPGLDQDEAQDVLTALRRTTPKGQTFSAGTAALHPDDVLETLLERADHSLYAAKDGGRDRVVVSA